MSVIFSKACEAALRALIEMARQPNQRFWSVLKLAEEVDVLAQYLAKIFQSLAREGILISSRGRWGGFAFAKSPDQIKLINIVETADGLDVTAKCALGLPECSNESPCPFHTQWGQIRELLVEALNSQTIAHLSQNHLTS